MRKLEFKSMAIQMNDFSNEHRTAVVAHAAYNNIDRLKDISRKGMFNKSWNENKADIEFRLDHKASQQPGKATDFWENDDYAFTKLQFAKTTLGNDVMEMADVGMLKGVSFGFAPIVAKTIEVKGQKVRELKEVYHGETSLIHTLTPINPKANIVSVTKAEEDWMLEAKAHLEKIHKFCRNAKASDETIKQILIEAKALEELISQYDDTDSTIDGSPESSTDEDELRQASDNEVMAKLYSMC